MIAAVLVVVDRQVVARTHTNTAPFAVFGVALSLFLGFRNNAACDRWSEARKPWSTLWPVAAHWRAKRRFS